MIELARLQPNEGQLPGLPKNPREIDKAKFEKLKSSLQRYPDLMRHCTLLVYPLDDEQTTFIIIGGNMRYHALTDIGAQFAPCDVIERPTDIETLQAYTVIHNSTFGKWDFDALANDWDTDLLGDWGLDVPSEKEAKDMSDSIEQVYKIEIDCADESEQERIFNELTEQGLQCRILTF